MTKVSFFTLGCRANQAETAVLEDVFRRRGFSLVDGKVPADITVINSCTVTGEGDRDARGIIGRVRQLNPEVRVALIGCQAQVQKEKLLAQANVCWVVGTAQKMRLADIILKGAEGGREVLVSPIRKGPFKMPLTAAAGRRTRANLKIQDGCDNFCAYCEVPFARGRARSREFQDVMAAARALVAAGHREIVLTGINTGLYADQGKDLVDVIKGVEKTRGLLRVRVSSVEYAPWLEKLAGLMRSPHKLCRSLHIPVQSGCDRVLVRMGRRYSSTQVFSLLERLQSKVQDIMLGTDVIAGFPGETDRDFEETFTFLERAPFHYFHVFGYSSRQRARSRSFKRQVPRDVVRARCMRLRELGQKKHGAFLRGMSGSVQDVLFEQKKGEHWFGHADNYATIKIKSMDDLHNRVVAVRVVGVREGVAIGEEAVA